MHGSLKFGKLEGSYDAILEFDTLDIILNLHEKTVYVSAFGYNKRGFITCLQNYFFLIPTYTKCVCEHLHPFNFKFFKQFFHSPYQMIKLLDELSMRS